VHSQGDLIHPVFKCHLSGVVSELLECRTEAAAAKILRGVAAETSVSSRPSPGPSRTIYCRRAKWSSLVLETKLSASNSSSSTATTTAPALPITADQQNLLSESAVEQDARLR
jgi:hypothetical protein